MSGTTAVYTISGMTCAHCEQAVLQEVTALPGVTTATADAQTGRLTITADSPVDEAAVRSAVDEAGYELA